MKDETTGLVSIIVPVYNTESCLADTLNCLAAQTYESLEFILIDDGSTDGSAAICKDFMDKDTRFTYVRQDNAGAGAARNHGIDLARGEFLMFADADDLYEITLVEELCAALQRDESDVAICRADVFIDGDENVPVRPYFDYPQPGPCCPSEIAGRFFQSFTCVPWDKLFRTSLVKGNHLRFQTLKYSNDNYFVLMSLLLSRCVTWGDTVLVHHRVGAGGSLRDNMYLAPTCDLEMLDALRSSVAHNVAAELPGLSNSLDTFTAQCVCSAFFILATQSDDGCRVFWRHLVTKSIPEWERLEGTSLGIDEFKLRLRFNAMKNNGPDRAIWAYSILGKNGTRTASLNRLRLAFLRFLVSPLFAGSVNPSGN